MVEITESATAQIAEYFKDKTVSPIRIFLNEGGWAGPGLAMALDEPRESDEVFDIDGFQYVVDKNFLETAKPIKVDFLEIGFKLTSSLVFEQGCTSGSCGGSCG